MKTINKHRLREFTRHIILEKKKHAEKEEESRELEGPKLFIKREFPDYHSRPPVQIIERKPAMPGKTEEIFELGKLTKFIIDKMIDSIECPGPNNPIKIKKESYTFQTDIILKEDEIMNIINIFSKESKMPISPIFKAEARGFSIMAIISSTGSRFLITRKK